MNPDKYPVQSSIILDITTAALAIEDRFSDLLIPPPPGAYLKGQMEPILFGDRDYFLFNSKTNDYYIARENREATIKIVENYAIGKVDYRQACKMKEGVMDSNGKVIVPENLAKQLVESPTVPVTALRLVRDLIDEFIGRSMSWTKQHSEEYSVIDKYFKKTIQWRDDHPILSHVQDPHNRMGLQCKQDVMEDILLHLRSIRADIASFIGQDSWMIHFTRYYGVRGLLIAKSIDYRVAYYIEKVRSGEWEG